jgi:hypothetical protein
MVGKIATGEIEDTSDEPIGSHGGKARAASLAPSRRSEIASLAAKRRWQRKGSDMTQAARRESEAETAGREAVRMYPNNRLGPQAREFDQAFSGFAMLRELIKKD